MGYYCIKGTVACYKTLRLPLSHYETQEIQTEPPGLAGAAASAALATSGTSAGASPGFASEDPRKQVLSFLLY